MSPSASQIEREVEASRANVEETMDALKDKMSVGQMVDEAARYFGDAGGSQMMTNLGSQVRDNPLPVLLIAAGVAWMMSGRGQSRTASRDIYHRDREWDDRDEFAPASAYAGGGYASRGGDGESWSSDGPSLSERASGAFDSASRTLHDVRDTIGGVARGIGSAAGAVASGVGAVASSVSHAASGIGSAAARTGSTLGSAGGSVAEGARHAGSTMWRSGSRAYGGMSRAGSGAYDSAARYGRGAYEGANWAGGRARQAASDILETEPFVLAAVGVAVGAAIGAMLPRTDVEDRYFGETRDRLRDDAEAYAREKFEQGKAVAEEAYQAVKDEAQSHGLMGDGDESLVGRLGDVARATLDRVRDSAAEKGLVGNTADDDTEQNDQDEVEERGEDRRNF